MVQRRLFVSAAAAGLFASLTAAPIRVGFVENGGVTVADGATVTQDGNVIVANEGTFNKSGKGTYALDQAKLDQSHRTALNVLEGKLALTAGQLITPAVTAEPACLAAKAALWVNADSVVTDGSAVTEWRDVRDVRNSTALYPRFKPQWSTATTGFDFTNQKPVLETTNGVTAVNFGGRQSNKYMRVYKANGTDASEISSVWHAYVVHGAYTCFGYVLGYHNARASFVSTMDATLPTLANASAMFLNRGDLHKRLQNARVRLNGDVVSPFVTKPLTGFQLLSFEHTDYLGYYSTLMYNNFELHKGGQGGDYIAEVILFTKHLTEAEQLEVERYLMSKYALSATDAKTPMLHQGYGATANLTVAADASVEVTAATGVTSAPVALSGNGSVVKKGPGTLAIGPMDESKPAFGGTFDFQEGSLFLRGGQLPPIVAKGGKKLTAAPENNGGDTLAKQAQSGIRGTIADQANATSFVKGGTGEARVNRVASDVKRVEVTGGTLVLEAPALTGGVVTNGGALYATIPNADFEMALTNMGANGRCTLYSHPANGWTAGDTPGAAYISTTNEWGTWCGSAMPRFGSQALLLVQANSATTTMTVPKSGYYEFTVWCHNRAGSWSATSAETSSNGPYSRTLLKLQLGKDSASVSTFGYAQGTSSSCPFVPTRVITPYLEAGDYCLKLAGSDGGNDASIVIDDVSCRFLTEERPQVAYRIPNGDFEAWTRSSNPLPYSFPYVTWRQLVSGWTWDFWNWNAGNLNQATNSLVGVTCAGTPVLRNNASCDYLLPFAEHFTGAGMLFLGAASNAHAKTTFTPPAGTYRLRANVWQRRTAVMVGASSSSELNLYGSPDADVWAKITRANGTEIPLGCVATLRGQQGREAVWAQDVTFDGTEAVTLTLWYRGGANGCIGVLVDDLALVDMTKPYDFGELITDGSFEFAGTIGGEGSGWKTYGDKSFYQYGYVATRTAATGDNWAFGHEIYEGSRFLRFQQVHGVHQTVDIPQPGTYRLTFRSMTRPNNLSGNGKNRIQSFFVDTSVTPYVTNRVHMLTPVCANFIEHSYLVKFTEAKKYEFYIGGAGYNPEVKTEDRVSSLDGVSLRRVTEELAEAPVVPETMKVSVADGADLCLNYTGTMKCAGVSYGGRIYHGLLSAATNPEFISGPGVIDAGNAPGLTIIFR